MFTCDNCNDTAYGREGGSQMPKGWARVTEESAAGSIVEVELCDECGPVVMNTPRAMFERITAVKP